MHFAKSKQVRCRQHCDKGVQERKLHQQLLPQHAAHAHLLEHLERGLVGHSRRPRPHKLVLRPVRFLLHGFHRRRLPVGGPVSCLYQHHHAKLVGSIRRLAPFRRPAIGLRLGSEELSSL